MVIDSRVNKNEPIPDEAEYALNEDNESVSLWLKNILIIEIWNFFFSCIFEINIVFHSFIYYGDRWVQLKRMKQK